MKHLYSVNLPISSTMSTTKAETKMSDFQLKCDDSLAENGVDRHLADRKKVLQHWFEEYGMCLYVCIGFSLCGLSMLFTYHVLENYPESVPLFLVALNVCIMGVVGLSGLVEDYWILYHKESFKNFKASEYDLFCVAFVIAPFLTAVLHNPLICFIFCTYTISMFALAGYFIYNKV